MLTVEVVCDLMRARPSVATKPSCLLQENFTWEKIRLETNKLLFASEHSYQSILQSQ